MIKANTNTSAMTTPYGVAVNSAIYGKTVRLIYGHAASDRRSDLVQQLEIAEQAGQLPRSLAITGQSSGGKKNGGGKKGGSIKILFRGG